MLLEAGFKGESECTVGDREIGEATIEKKEGGERSGEGGEGLKLGSSIRDNYGDEVETRNATEV